MASRRCRRALYRFRRQRPDGRRCGRRTVWGGEGGGATPEPLEPAAPQPFWRPDRHAARRPRLVLRARIAATVRAWFDAKGFVEVDPAALQASPGNESHLHRASRRPVAPDGAPRDACLQTSPEFAMKKLLAAGETRIFALTHVFRNRERGALHAPEFAMLEWYRAGAPLDALMDDCATSSRWRPCRGRNDLRLPRPRGEPVRAA